MPLETPNGASPSLSTRLPMRVVAYGVDGQLLPTSIRSRGGLRCFSLRGGGGAVLACLYYSADFFHVLYILVTYTKFVIHG